LTANHYVRVGLLAQVGRFRSVDATRYPRGTRVIVRTERGLEIGEVLGAADVAVDEVAGGDWSVAADGPILRRMTVEDQLLEARIERHRDEAFEACRRRLDEAGVAATLVDVEHLFDGRGVYFYFLGQPPGEVEGLTADLADVYDANVHFRRFAELLTAGCGPDCGTEHAAGGGCANCATGCAVADACRAR
jgi:cell fate regulator YaaT (PSP1 superfamily)